jgi:hypothetical protein
MTEIRPLAVKDIPYARALALPPSLELDMFVFANVLQGPDEMLAAENMGRLPGLSRKFGDCQMLLIMAVKELGSLTVDVDPGFFEIAVAEGFIVRKKPCVVWRIAAATAAGYGRNFEEALCKLLIVTKCAKN